ncbi:MAG: hypothetical protein WKF42_02420 [Solirubrobacteraceae bacterium]
MSLGLATDAPGAAAQRLCGAEPVNLDDVLPGFTPSVDDLLA